MPKPGKNEKQKEFMSRCISQVVGEGKGQEQAVAMCSSIWENKAKAAHHGDMKKEDDEDKKKKDDKKDKKKKTKAEEEAEQKALRMKIWEQM
jgi:hypothetical protein